MNKIFDRYFKNLKAKFYNTKTARLLVDCLFLGWSLCIIYIRVDLLRSLFCFAAGFVVYKCFYSIIKTADDVNNEMPNFGRRFTKKESDGSIIVKNGELHEAMLYLYSIEEYMERNR